MVTSNFTSKYQVMAFSVLALSILLALMLLLFTSPNILDPKFWNDLQSIGILLAALMMFALGSLPLLKMKIIRIKAQHIVFQNYLFSSNIKEVNINTYEYYKIVHEESENGIFEAVWLIKDGKLANSFSSYQYSNYKDLKSALKLKNKGELEMSPLEELLYRFGKKI